MPCGCSANKKKLSAAAAAVAKMRVHCPDCETGLIGMDEVNYPLHLTPVIVSAEQVNIWKQAGYPVQILT